VEDCKRVPKELVSKKGDLLGTYIIFGSKYYLDEAYHAWLGEVGTYMPNSIYVPLYLCMYCVS